MRLQTFILTFLFCVASIPVSFGQGSAQAVMRVSVEVVKGSCITAETPRHISIIEHSESTLGALTMVGVNKDDVLVSIPDFIILKDSSGRTIEITVKGSQKNIDRSTSMLDFVGIAKTEAEPGMYSGALTTTIEYF